MQIKKAAPEDVDSLAKIHSLTWQKAYQNIFSQEFLKTLTTDEKITARKKKFQNDISENSCLDIFLLEDFFGGKMKKIGFIILSSLEIQKKHNPPPEIIAFYILPDFWGQGFGNAMMQFSIQRFQNFHAKEIILWVLKKNTRAKLFYERFGFIASGKEKVLNIENAIEIEYKLSLNK